MEPRLGVHVETINGKPEWDTTEDPPRLLMTVTLGDGDAAFLSLSEDATIAIGAFLTRRKPSPRLPRVASDH